MEQFGRVDAVANCVGSIVLKSAHTTTDMEFDQVSLDTPVLGVPEGMSLGLCAYASVPTVGDPTPLGGHGVLLVVRATPRLVHGSQLFS